MKFSLLSTFISALKTFGFLVSTVVLATSHSLAQEAVWGKFFDSDRGAVTMEACALPSGEVLLFGYYDGELPVGNEVLVPKYDNHGSFIIKLGNDGSLVSAFPVDGRYVYIENAVIDSKGDVVVSGRFFGSIEFNGVEYMDQSTSTSHQSAFVAKYSQDGTAHWIQVMPNSGYTTIAADENDDIYVLTYEMMDFYATSSYLRKYNKNGGLIFENKFLRESEAQSYPRCIDVRNGEAIVGGMVYGSGTIFNSFTYTGLGYGYYLAHFNADGSIKWTKSIGETTYNNPDISDVMFDDDGSFYVTGGLSDNMLLAKYDGQGSLQWSKKSLPQSFAHGYLCKGTDGSIFLTTNFYDKAEIDGHVLTATPDSPVVLNAPNVGLIKFDAAGNVLGIQQFQPHIVNVVCSISVTGFNEIFISGFSDAPSIEVGSVSITSPNDTWENNGDGYVVKFNGTSLGAPGFDVLANEVCGTTPVAFTTSFDVNEIKSIVWDFGDPSSGNQNTSLQKTPSHTFTAPGLYKVRVAIADKNNKVWYSSLIFEVHAIPQISLGDDFTLCEGQTKRLEPGTGNSWSYTWQDGSPHAYFDVSMPGEYRVTVVNQYCESADTVQVTTAAPPAEITIADSTLCSWQVYTVDLSAVNGTILWNDGYTLPSRTITLAGTYTVTATNDCGIESASFTVDVIAPLSLSVESAIICRGESYTVDLTDIPATITWSTGENDTVKEIFEPGTYVVNASNSCETKVTTFTVSTIEPFDIYLGEDQYVCDNSRPAVLHAPEIIGGQYRWSTGSTDKTISVGIPGTYWLEVTTSCHTARDSVEVKSTSVEELNVPNFITPNGDAQNEYFTLDEQLTGASLLVYNRWGKQVYATENYNNNWNAPNLESAIYYYIVPEFCLKGWIHVQR